MPAGLSSEVSHQLETLFNSGTVAELADGALLQRFVASRDEAAFEALVIRNGPMVLRVCRASLPDDHDAADAFQAVFLVLVRRAGSVRSQSSIASWLFGVASRTSKRSRVEFARRRRKELAAGSSIPAIVPEPIEDNPDVSPILHEEVARLPGRYREVIVLCYFEGSTCLDAARRLGRPAGTIRAQLSRARAILKQRLVRRGIALSAGWFAAGDPQLAPAVQLPLALAGATVSAASRFAAGTAVSSRQVALLVEGVLRSMLIRNVSVVAVSSVLALAAAGALAIAGESWSTAVVLPVQLAASVDEPRHDDPVARALKEVLQATPGEPRDQDPVARAVKEALPAATDALGPYTMTLALIRVARAQLASGEREDALATFRLADAVAGKVGDTQLRRLAVMRTAAARGKAGDTTPARTTLERFVREGVGLGPAERNNLMSMVIEFQYDAGFLADAEVNLKRELASIDALDDEKLRERGINRILRTQLSIGDYEGALRQAERYQGTSSNLRARYLQIIMSFNRNNAKKPTVQIAERAQELARDVTYPYPRALAEREIAAALARAGDMQGALAVAYTIGKRDARSQLASSIRMEITPALAEIARVQAKTGDVASAKETLRAALELAQLVSPRDANYAPRLREVAEAQGEVGDVDGARQSARLIGYDPAQNALALVALSRAQSKVGDAAAARDTLADAVVIASRIVARPSAIGGGPDGTADGVFRAVALARAEAGDAKGAIAVVASRASAAWQSETRAAIVPIQARLGDFTGALATAGTITDLAQDATAYSAIALEQSRAGDSTSALSWASRLANPGARALALIGIAEGVAVRKGTR